MDSARRKDEPCLFPLVDYLRARLISRISAVEKVPLYWNFFRSGVRNRAYSACKKAT